MSPRESTRRSSALAQYAELSAVAIGDATPAYALGQYRTAAREREYNKRSSARGFSSRISQIARVLSVRAAVLTPQSHKTERVIGVEAVQSLSFGTANSF